MRRHSILAALLFTVPAALPAQRFDVEGAESCREIWREYGRSVSGRPRAVHCEIREVGVMPRREQLDFDAGNYTGIRVTGAKRSDVRVRLVVQAQGASVADARDLARGVRLDITTALLRVDGMLRDRDDDRDDDRRWVSAIVVMDAPEQSNLMLRVRYGQLAVENVSGRMDLRASYGPIELRDVGGDVRARVDYGPIMVDLSGTKWQGVGLDAESAYGPVTLRVPRDYSADLEIGADHGPIDVDFPLTLRRFDRSFLETKIGAGGPRLRAVARYGPMSLKMSR